MAIRASISATEILMDVSVVRPGAVTNVIEPPSGRVLAKVNVVLAGAVVTAQRFEAYPTWQTISVTARSGYDPTCPFYFESLTASDNFFADLGRPITDSLTVSDDVVLFNTQLYPVSDSVTATDSAATVNTMARSITDAATATDGAITALTTSQSVSDSVSATDSVVAGFQFYETPSDAITSSDSAVTQFTIGVPVGDTSSVSDSLQIIWQRANMSGEVANASPVNFTALNDSTPWVEQWTFNY